MNRTSLAFSLLLGVFCLPMQPTVVWGQEKGGEEVFEAEAEIKQAESEENNCLKFHVILLERTTRETPPRTLAEEVREAIATDEAESSTLVARITPLLSREPNRVTRLVDYFQASTLAGDQVEVQKGARDRRGTNLGTLVRIIPLSGEGENVDVSVMFEKSYVPSAVVLTAKQGEAVEEAAASEAARKKAEEAFLAQLSERERQVLSQIRQREGRPSLASEGQSATDVETMTVQGSLALTLSQPAVFGELAGRSEQGFHEYVILIEAHSATK